MVSYTHIRRAPIFCVSVLTLALYALVGMPAVVHAQSVTTEVSAQEISTQDVLTYRVEAEGSVQGVEPTFSEDFRVVGQSTQTSISFINGQTTRKLTASFQLAPVSAGTLNTGSATIRFKNGQTSRAKSYTIQVKDTGASPRTSTRPSPPASPAPPRSPWLPSRPPQPQSLAPKAFGEYPTLALPGSEELYTQDDWQPPNDRPFVLPFIHKKRVVVGEPFLVEYLYMEPLTALGFEAQDMDEPEFPYAWFEDISEARLSAQPRRLRLRFRGVYYNAQIVRSYMVVALRDGTYTIPPLGLTLVGYTLTQRLESFHVASPQLNIEVESPPPHDGTEPSRPNVGRYHFHAELREEEARMGDTVHLDLRIEGIGLPAHVHFPDVKLPSELRKLSAPEEQRTRQRSIGWIETTKTQQLSFQPTKEGDIEIPPIVFQWFDPWDRAWKRSESDALTLRVRGHAPEAKQKPAAEPEEAKVSSSWLAELPTGEHTSEREGMIARMRQYDEPWRGNLWYFFLIFIPVGSFLGLLAFEKLTRLRKKTRDVRQYDSAATQARRALKKCPPSDLESFTRMDQIMRKYLRARGIDGTRGATYKELHDALRQTRTEPQADALISHLQALEEARYGGADPVRFHALRNQLLAWLEHDAKEDV